MAERKGAWLERKGGGKEVRRWSMVGGRERKGGRREKDERKGVYDSGFRYVQGVERKEKRKKEGKEEKERKKGKEGKRKGDDEKELEYGSGFGEYGRRNLRRGKGK